MVIVAWNSVFKSAWYLSFFATIQAYKYMAKRGWNIGIIRLFNDALYEEGLSAETLGLTNGLRYHLIDICVDELAKVNKDAETPLTEATFLDCVEPFFALAQKALDKNVQKRVMDNVLLKFLNEYSFVSAVAVDDEVDDKEKALIFNQVHVGTVSKFIFQIASDIETDERFRKSLYEMHKTYERRIKTAGRDVGDLELCDDINEEVNEGNDHDESNISNLDEEVQPADSEADEIHDANETSHENDETLQPTNATSSDKKKRKKKKKKAEKDTAAADSAAVDESKEDDGLETEITTPKKSSSKKKRKNEDSDNDGKKVEVANVKESAPCDEKEQTEILSSTMTKSSKKKKNKKKHDSDSTDNNSSFITSHVETPTPNAKRKKQKSPPSVDPRSMNSLDHIIMSSNSSDNGSDDIGASPSRRVSFGTTNHCKSHKASMKAVKTLEKERWDTRRTPEKGILRPRSSSRKKKGNVL